MGQGDELERSGTEVVDANVGPIEQVGTVTGARKLPWQRLLAELAVIFLGVFLAIAADDWREKRQERETAGKLALALQSSFEDLRRYDREGYPEYTAEQAVFDRALAAGERPAYPYLHLKGSQKPPTEVWEAFLAAGGARLFPPDVVFDLARFFYSAFRNVGDREVVNYRFMETEVLPTLRTDPNGAYLPGTARLKPLWAEQLERQREAARTLHRLSERTLDLEKRVFASVGRAVPPPRKDPLRPTPAPPPHGDKPARK
jgi:hypothetical protein